MLNPHVHLADQQLRDLVEPGGSRAKGRLAADLGLLDGGQRIHIVAAGLQLGGRWCVSFLVEVRGGSGLPGRP